MVKARQWTVEEKLAVVLAGLRGEATVAELCQRHGISEATYYNWQKAVFDGARQQLDENAPAPENALDDVERQLILLLQRDGRASFVDMARQVGVAEGTIRRKFHRLMDAGIIRIVAVTDPFKVGVEAPVLIGLNLQPGQAAAVAARLAEIPSVRYIVSSAGEHDLILECLFSSRSALSEFLTRDLAGIAGIVATTTSLLLAIHKNAFDWGLPKA